jgi:toxin HigB-1
MINRVLISKKAAKNLEHFPLHIVLKLQGWRDGVEKFGLEEMRKQPGYHDEPLKGDRKGQRSIRLSKAYRAIYRIVEEKVVFVLIEEVNKHDY